MPSSSPWYIPLALLAASCTHEVPASDAVQHLDLQLENGEASSRALLRGELAWVEQQAFTAPDADQGAWSTQYCRVDRVPQGAPGVALIGVVQEAGRTKRVELRSSKTYAASEIDFVELELARTTQGIACIGWKSSLDGPESLEYPRSASVLVPTTREPVRVRISLAAQPGWGGQISELSIAPKEEGIQRVDLIAVRLGRTGFTPGPDPQDPAADGTASDGGLIALGREARRAFPCDWNVPLFAHGHVPRGGRLSVECGVSTNTTNVTAEVRFRVDARAAGEKQWQRAGSTSIVPGMRAQGPAWEHLSVPLAAFEGRDVELRFLANEQAEPEPGGTLARARLFWGEPLLTGAPPASPRPNVVLVTLDTVRADAIGALRAPGEKSPTPFLDGLAARGILFENAWSACDATLPSHASLLTGLAVQDHGLVDNHAVLGAENVTLAERFRAAGWQTAAAVSVPHLNPGQSGLGQGFDRFWRADLDSAADGAVTIAGVREWLRSFARDGARPTFLWVHLFDAHTPYEVPKSFLESYAKRMGVSVPQKRATPPTLPQNRFSGAGEFLADVDNRAWVEFTYRACVAYEDELLRRLFSELEQRGGSQNTWIAVVADHGEALGEHDNFYHHSGLYQEVMHVPLILVAPGGPRGVRVKEPVWSLDLARTLFGVAGGPVPDSVRGVDLLEFTASANRPVRRIFFEHSDLAQEGCVDGERSAIHTLLDYDQFGRERRIPADTLELFDSAADPAQVRELGSSDPAASSGYREHFAAWRKDALKRKAQRAQLSDEEAAQLERLGY